MSSEEQLIEWVRANFKNRKELADNYQKVYNGLLRCYPHILDIALPVISTPTTKKEQLLQIAKNGEERPHYKTKLVNTLNCYIGKAQPCYDEEFTNKLKQIRPEWFENYQEKQKRLSFEKMMKFIPDSVKFKEGQIWSGAKDKYIFICEKYGEFENIPSRLMCTVWKSGLSGHPQMGKNISRLKFKLYNYVNKKTKNLNTNEIFPSATIAAKSINRSSAAIGKAIKNGTKCGGYNWEYVDE